MNESSSMRTVPAGKVLVVFWSDWFTYESGYAAYQAGSEVESAKLCDGQAKLLDDGRSLDVVSKIRNDPNRHAWTLENRRITNKAGKVEDVLLRSAVVMG